MTNSLLNMSKQSTKQEKMGMPESFVCIMADVENILPFSPKQMNIQHESIRVSAHIHVLNVIKLFTLRESSKLMIGLNIRKRKAQNVGTKNVKSVLSISKPEQTMSGKLISRNSVKVHHRSKDNVPDVLQEAEG